MAEFYQNQPVLILGGLGFIGSNLAHCLSQVGAKLTLVDCLLPEHGGNPRNIAGLEDRVQVVSADIRDSQELERLVRGQKVIFSLAAQVSHVGSMHDPLLDLDINARAQLGLLEACRKHNPQGRIVFASTRQVYGRPEQLPLTEEAPVRPVDANGISKHSAELYYLLFHRAYGIPSVVLRMTNTYGPRMNLHGRGGGFVGRFLQCALTGTPIDVFGDGRQRRDFNYVDDVVDALMRAGSTEGIAGQVFNLGHAEHHSVLDLVHLLQHFSGVSYRLTPYPKNYAAIEVGDCYCDFSKFRAATGWLPRHNLATGLGRTWSWLCAQNRGFPSLGEDRHDSGIRPAFRVLAAEAGN